MKTLKFFMLLWCCAALLLDVALIKGSVIGKINAIPGLIKAEQENFRLNMTSYVWTTVGGSWVSYTYSKKDWELGWYRTYYADQLSNQQDLVYNVSVTSSPYSGNAFHISAVMCTTTYSTITVTLQFFSFASHDQFEAENATAVTTVQLIPGRQSSCTSFTPPGSLFYNTPVDTVSNVNIPSSVTHMRIKTSQCCFKMDTLHIIPNGTRSYYNDTSSIPDILADGVQMEKYDYGPVKEAWNVQRPILRRTGNETSFLREEIVPGFEITALGAHVVELVQGDQLTYTINVGTSGLYNFTVLGFCDRYYTATMGYRFSLDGKKTSYFDHSTQDFMYGYSNYFNKNLAKAFNVSIPIQAGFHKFVFDLYYAPTSASSSYYRTSYYFDKILVKLVASSASSDPPAVTHVIPTSWNLVDFDKSYDMTLNNEGDLVLYKATETDISNRSYPCISHFEDEEWIEYTNVVTNVEGVWHLKLTGRVSSTAGYVHLYVNGSRVGSQWYLSASTTYGWYMSSFYLHKAPITRTVELIPLPIGTHRFRIVFVSSLSSYTKHACLHKLTLDNITATPFVPGFARLPGVVEAENFDGGSGSIHEKTASNEGNYTSYRSTSVDIFQSGNRTFVDMKDEERLTYSVYLDPLYTAYKVRIRYRMIPSGSSTSGYIHFCVACDPNYRGKTIYNSGSGSYVYVRGNNDWAEVTSGSYYATSGWQILNIRFDLRYVPSGTAINEVQLFVDSFEFFPSAGPFMGTFATIPGIINASNYDFGGSYDKTAENTGNKQDFRPNDGTDISIDAAGNVGVVDVESTEYLSFTVDIASTGYYEVFFTGIVAQTVPSSGLFSLSGGDYIGGRFSFAGPIVNRLSVGVIDLQVSGRKALMVSFVSDGVRFIQSLEFVRLISPTPQSYLKQPIADGIIPVWGYDLGGPGISYYDTTVGNSGGVYRRSSDSVDILTYSGKTAVSRFREGEWLHYTFSVEFTGIFQFGLEFRCAYTRYKVDLNFEFSDGDNRYISFYPGTTYLQEKKLFQKLLSAYTTYTMNFSIPMNATSSSPYYYLYLTEFSVKGGDLALQENSCYERPSVLTGCANPTTTSVNCSALVSPQPISGVSTSLFQGCGFHATSGTETHALQFGAPTTSSSANATAVKSATMVFSRSYTPMTFGEEIPPGTSFPVGNEIKNDQVTLRVQTDGVFLVLHRFIPERVIWSQTVSENVASLEFTSGDALKLIGADGYTLKTLKSSSGTSAASVLQLIGCRLVIREGRQAWVSIYYSKGYTNCPVYDGGLYNAVYLHYSSGRKARAGFVRRRSTDGVVEYVPSGHFPSNEVRSICETPTSASSIEGNTAVAITSTPQTGEILASVRVLNFDSAEPVVVAGLVWLRPSSTCFDSVISRSALMENIAVGVSFQVGTRYSSTTLDTCVGYCTLDTACKGYSFASSLCYVTKYSVSPSLAEKTYSDPLQVVIGFRQDVSTIPTFRSGETQTISKPTVYPSSLGWQKMLFSLSVGGKIAVAASGITAVSLTVSESSFETPEDWALLVAPEHVAQCGPALRPFDERYTLLLEGFSRNCNRQFATCGSIAYGSATAGIITVTGSESSLRVACGGIRFHGMLFVKGTVEDGKAELYYAYSRDSVPASYQSIVSNSREITIGSNIYSLTQFSPAPASTSSLSDRVMCVFEDAQGFIAREGLGVLTCSGSRSVSIDQMASECETDSDCAGFTTLVSPSAGETVQCVLTSANEVLLAAIDGSVYYKKRVATNTKCTHTVTKKFYDSLKVSVTQTDFVSTNNIVTVTINGSSTYRCGGREGFEGTSGMRGLCNRMLTCFDMPIYMHPGTIIEVSISASVTSRGRCGYAAAAMLEFTASGGEDVGPIIEGMNRREVLLPAATPKTFYIFAKPSHVALLYRGWQDYGVRNYKTPGTFSMTVMPRSTGQASTTTGPNSTNYKMKCNTGSAVTSSRIYSKQTCNIYALCSHSTAGVNINGTGGRLHQINRTGTSLQSGHAMEMIQLQYTPYTSPQCSESTVRAVLLFHGPSFVPFEGRSGVRAQYVFQVKSNASSSPATSIRAGEIADAFKIPANNINIYPEYLAFTVGAGSFATTNHIILFDVPSIDERVKKWGNGATVGTIGNGSFACIIDSFPDGGSRPTCRIPTYGADYVMVRVAQTAFRDPTFRVQISAGQTKKRCGGDRTFQGELGRHGQCGEFLTCFASSLENGTSEVFITFEPPTEAPPCLPAAFAVAIVENRGVSSLSCSSGEFACSASGNCLPASQICDGDVQCPDGSDEALCSGWRLVSTTLTAQCSANVSMPPQSTISFEDCRNWAIAHAIEFSSSSSFWWEENERCEAYNCLDLSNPQAWLGKSSRGVGNFYVHLESAEDLYYCSRELSCSGNGEPSSTVPSCVCQCYTQYVGIACGVIKDMSVVQSLGMVFDTNSLSSVDEANILQVLTIATQNQLFQPSIKQIIYSGSSTRHRSAFGSEALVTVELNSVSSTSTAEKTRVLLHMMEQESRIALLKGLKDANLTLQELTSPSIFESVNTSECVISAPGSSCSITAGDPEILSGQGGHYLTSYVIAFQGVQFTDSSATVTPKTGVTCTTVETVVDSNIQDETCQISILCSVVLASKQELKSFSWKPSLPTLSASTGCRQGLATTEPTTAVRAVLTYNYVTTISNTTSTYRTTVTVEEKRTSQGEAAFYVLIIFGALGFLLAVSACTAKGKVQAETDEDSDEDSATEPSLSQEGDKINSQFKRGFFAFLFLVVGIAGFGLWYDAFDINPTHHFFIDEYRSNLCAASRFSLIPHRVSRVAADGVCHKLEAVGTNEGTLFLRAECTTQTTTNPRYNGEFKVAFGLTLKECKTALYQTLVRDFCYREGDIFTSKTQVESEFFVADCFTTTESDHRWAGVTNNFSPVPIPNRETTPAALTAEMRFDGTPNIIASYVGNRRQLLPRIQLGEIEDVSVSFAAVPKSNLSDIANDALQDQIFFHDDGRKETPSTSGDNHNQPTNVGLLFNGFTTPTQLSGKFAGTGSFRYQSIRGTMADVGLLTSEQDEDLTLSFWMRADQNTRGFAFAATDNWVNRESFESAIISRTLQIIESGLSAGAYFRDTWHMYYGLYVSGTSKSLHFIYASPGDSSSGVAGVAEMVWDTALSNLNVTKLFDNNWHFVTLVFSQFARKRYAQIFLDGETSFVTQGWRQCFEQGDEIPAVQSLPPSIKVFSKTEDVVLNEGVLFVGYFNGGIFNLQFQRRFLEHERIIAMGAPAMKKNAVIWIDRSKQLGYALAAAAALSLLIGLVQIVIEGRQAAKEELEEKDRKRVAAQSGNETGRSGGRVTTNYYGASQLKVIIPQVFLVAQTLGLYMSGWRWPFEFQVSLGWIIAPLNLDFNFPFWNMPYLLTPILQFAVASLTVALMIYAAAKDKLSYEKTTIPILQRRLAGEAAGEGDAGTNEYPRPIHTDALYSFEPTFMLDGKDYIILDPAARDLVRDHLKALVATKPHQAPVNSPPIDLPVVKKGWMSKKRQVISALVQVGPTARKHHYRKDIFVQSIRDDDHHPQAAQPQSTSVGKLCALQMKIVEPRSCARCHERLIAATENHTKALVGGRFPYVCNLRLNSWFSRTTENKNACPTIVEHNFYVCPHDDCGFCVCADCAEYGAWAGCRAKLGGVYYSYKKSGAFYFLGLAMLIVAMILYLPVMKTAVMILYCHPQFQCEFPDCYESMTAEFRLAVIFGSITALGLGIGMPMFMYQTVARRKIMLIESGLLDGKFLNKDGDIDPTVRPTSYFEKLWVDIPQPMWAHILEFDNSILKPLYDQYEFKFMAIHASTLVFKLLLVLPIVFFAPNTLSQLVGAGSVEAMQLLFFIITSAYINHYIDFLGKFGSVHMLTQLCLMCFHRAAIAQDPAAEGYGKQMIIVACIYLAMVILIVVRVVIVPAIQQHYEEKEKREEMKRQAEQGGFEIAHGGSSEGSPVIGVAPAQAMPPKEPSESDSGSESESESDVEMEQPKMEIKPL